MKFWRYHPLDGILTLVAAAQLVATVVWAFAFESLPWAWNLVIFPVMALAFYFNPIVVVHNFLHCPFFSWSPLNRAFAAINSINLGLPQVLYKYHHIIHHRFSNGADDPSSTYRFGKNGKQENWVSYSGLGLFRDATTYAYRETIRRGERSQLGLEAVCNLAGYALWIAIDWKFFLAVYVPLFYVGWFLAHVENYFEHHHATDAADRFANSVSYYPRWYNRLMFNEGYHQEHHIEPARHWRERPTVRARYRARMESSKTHVASYPPLLGFME